MSGRRIRILLLLLLVVLVGTLLARSYLLPARIPSQSVLLLELAGAYAEAPPPDALARFFRRRERTLLDLVTLLRRATKDDRIKGLVLRVGKLDIGWAKAQDLREALVSFKASGKRLVAYLEQEVSAGNLEYYLASVASEVYLPPDGSAPLTGLSSQFFFLGGVWEKLDIEMHVEKIREYKTFGDMLANKSMTAAHREMANSLLDSVNQQFVGGIAAARGLDDGSVQATINDCPITPDAFAKAHLSDGTRFLDEIREDLVGPHGKFLDEADYQPRESGFMGFGGHPALAVIYASGAIHSGDTGRGLSGDGVGSDNLVEAFESAAADDDARAIVFRIDSPGGSALASDLIWRATQMARAKKPVIVSMSDVAGSGGYYIAAGGTQIVAQPGTLTGSIGVVMARPDIRGLLAKLGVTTETLIRGKYARLEDIASGLTPDERAKMVGAMQHIYDVFVDRVAAGRKLTRERVNEIGRGRVWTGAQAKERGLVDELGGFTRAIELAKQAAGLAIDEEVRLVFYPHRKNVLERLANYVETRTTIALPASWQRAAAVLAPLDFPDGAMLALMAETIAIR